jgi:hypothetical protein
MNLSQTSDIPNVPHRRRQVKLESLSPAHEAFSTSQIWAQVKKKPSPSSPSALAFSDGIPSHNLTLPAQPPNNPADGLAGFPSLPDSSSSLNPVRVPMPGQELPSRRSKRIPKPSRRAAEAEYAKKVDEFVENVKRVTTEWNELVKTMNGTQGRAQKVNGQPKFMIKLRELRQPRQTIRIPRWGEHCRALDRAGRGCGACRSL